MTEQDFERLCTVVDQTNANDADKDALKHALKYQFTVSSLEASLRGGHDYDYIINAALTATREFYDADSVLFANTDVNLHVAGSLMRELPREGFSSLSGNDPVYLSKYPLFLKAIEYGQPVAVTDMSQMFPANSIEYKRLRKSNVRSFMAAPSASAYRIWGNTSTAVPWAASRWEPVLPSSPHPSELPSPLANTVSAG